MRLETPPPALQDLIDQARAMPLGREERDVVRQALTMAEELHLDGGPTCCACGSTGPASWWGILMRS